MTSLAGRWALVTGASRGVGQQIAQGLARRGCNLIVHGRAIRHAEQTIKLLELHDIDVFVVGGDLSSPAGVQSVIDAVETQVGGIDILYNNAAVGHAPAPILKQPQALWDYVFQVNLWALIALCQAFAPGMKARNWGRIINLTSGISGQPALAAYSVSKAAVDKFSQDLAADLKASNVLVNTLDPGWVRTDMGGLEAEAAVETVLPGALVPALLEDNGPTGRHYAAQDFRVLG